MIQKIPFIILLFSLSVNAQDPDEDQFGQVEYLELNEVTVAACSSGKKPCYEGRPDLGCVPYSLIGKAFDTACKKFDESRKEFDFSCFIKINGNKAFFGKTKSKEICLAMQEVWDEISKDPILASKSNEWRLRFLKNTLLSPRSGNRKDNPVISSNLEFKNNGKIRKVSDETDRIMKKVKANLADYRNELNCGVGVIPGMDQIPVLNQKSQGTCYAHAAYTLIDYTRKTRGGGRYPVFGSPLMGAIDYQLNSKGDRVESCRDPMAGGFTCDAYNAAMKRGFCSSQDIEKAIIRSYNNPTREKKGSWYIDWAKKQKMSVSTAKFNVVPDDHVLEYLHLIGTYYEEKNWKKIKELHEMLKRNGSVCENKPVDLDVNWEMIQLSKDLETFYSNFFGEVCNREAFPFQAKCAETIGQPSISQIDRALENGYPLGVSYCSEILTNSKYKSTTVPITDAKDCGPHASVIAGTAVDSKGRCTYVIRNSWGMDCGYYDNNYDCKDGHIYIPKELFLKQVFAFQEIKVQ
jgi:hypothetical protein